MDFKNIEATFRVKGELKEGVHKGWKFDYTIKIKRIVSGANAYGDRSAHIVEYYKGDEVSDKTYCSEEYFDTRYDCIPADKQKWLEYWIDWLQQCYKGYDILENLSYQENIESLTEKF